MNGIDIAHNIQLRHKDIVIIAMSNFVEYAVDGYGAIFRYVLKSRFEKMAGAIFDEAVKMLEISDQYAVNIKIKNDFLRLQVQKIAFIESNLRLLKMHMHDGVEYEFYGKLDDYEKELESKFFIRVHSSYLVNCKYVSRFTRDQITMYDGEIIPVSKRKYSAAFDRFAMYAKGEL